MKINISYLIMLYSPHIFNIFVFLFSKDLNTKIIVTISTAIVVAVQLHRVIPNKLESWIAYSFINLIVLLPIYMYTLETFFIVVTIGTFLVALYLLIRLHQFVNEKLNLGNFLSILVMLFISLILAIFLFYVYLAFLFNLIETHPNSLFLIYITKYINLNLIKTILVALFSLILVFYVFEALFKIAKSETLISKSRYQIMLLLLFSLVALILPDTVFSFLYLSFAETSDSNDFLNQTNNNDASKMFFYYIKSFYYSFCLHFAVPIPTTGFYSNMQHAVMSYPHLKVLQFLHYTQNKLVELTLFAVIAGHVSNALGLGTKNSNEDTIKAGENHR
ncbi:hypothetical protein [Paenibacillus sp. TC-CSREp1]|uniref:hypothetical protein n=1 Tax=Paenibacillus sp. TC-CSREp1 TaxID=3410089 RepID=UPI003CFF3E00